MSNIMYPGQNLSFYLLQSHSGAHFMSPLTEAFLDHRPEAAFLSDWLDALRTEVARRGISAKDFARLIGVSSEKSARRRLTGQTPLRAYELLRCAQVFGLPLDPRTASPLDLGFSPASPPAAAFSPERYLAGILALVQALARMRDAAEANVEGGTSQRPTYYVSTTDVPFSPLCTYPRLAALRLFTLEGGGGRLDVDFDYDAMRAARPKLFDDIAKVGRLYLAEDNVEIWGARPLESLIQTLTIHRERGVVSAGFAKACLEDLNALTEDIRLAAKTSRKSGGGRFELYRHGLVTRSTYVVIRGGGIDLTLQTLQHPHFAISRKPATADYFLSMFEELRRDALPISGQAPFHYRDYADELRADIEAARQQLLATA